MPGPVVTIARQDGCGGAEIAERVARQLGVPLLDREIISRAAESAGVSEQALSNAERSASLLNRMLESLSMYGTAAGPDGVSPEVNLSTSLLATSADFRSLLQQALRDIAGAGPAVILGHAAQVALRDTPGTIHVFLHAPMDYRVARFAHEHGVTVEQARRQLEASDRERVHFFQTAYHVDWYDLRLYDLVLDTQLVGIPAAAEKIAALALQATSPLPEARRLTPVPVAPEPAPAAEDATTVLLGGQEVHIRPMTPADTGALLSLFRSLPPEDLLFLRRDVTDELAVEAWARDVADGRVVTLLAEVGGKVVGEATLRPSAVPWTRHVGEVRVITAPELRGRGLGRTLLHEILEAARAAGVEKLTAEMTVEQAAARRMFEHMGFVEEGRYHAYARDQTGTPHDLLVMTHTA